MKKEKRGVRIPFKIILKWTLLGLLFVFLAFLIGYISFVMSL